MLFRSNTELQDIHDDAGICGDLYHYQSRTPWLALNEENYERYMQISGVVECRARLERIMAANMLALSKNVGLDVQEKIMVKLLRYDEVRLKAGQTPLLGFQAEFVTNFRIPAFVGVGKMVSKGFGLMGKCLGRVEFYYRYTSRRCPTRMTVMVMIAVTRSMCMTTR